MQNVTETIISYYEKLHPVAKRIADYILSRQYSVMDATIQCMSDKIGFATASISRFTRTSVIQIFVIF
ncbi:hypothetical protein [Oenococcus oeni]|uniref:hypothetical protein n=1 Tax=Oenococcus oeni TaxID=1247 RepID=UPI00214B62E6|nr:hypothetical protein [Oenococcus oeni]